MTQQPNVPPAAPPAPPSLALDRRWAVTVALAAAGMALAAAALHHRTTAAADVTPPFTVSGEHVALRDGAATWSYLDFARADLQAPLAPAPMPARVAFDETRAAPVIAPLAGRVEAAPVRIGQRVARGDRLVAIRSPEFVDLSKEIDAKRAKESAKAKAVERLRALVVLEAEPSKKLIDAEQELQQASLGRTAAELKLRSLAVSTDDASLYWLIAPRDGVVVQRDVLSGQVVGPERAEPLLVVAELDEVIVDVDVPEADVADLQVGQSAEVRPSGAGESAVPGRIEYIGAVVDPQRRMVEARVRVPNGEKLLRPNAFVQVAFSPDARPRVVVPSQAVVTDDQQSFVFVRRDDTPGTLERREVALGRQRDGRVEIARGLAAGENYVTRGAILLLNAVDLASH